MKKLILILLLSSLTHCPITNKLFLKPSRVYGTEAKEILNNRLSSLFVNDISTNSSASLGFDFLIPVLAGVEDAKIYRRRDVENCATRVFLAAIAIDQPNIIANRTKTASTPLRTSDPLSRLFPPLLCEIKEVDGWIDID